MRGAALRKVLKQLSGDAEGRKSAEFRMEYKKKFAEYTKIKEKLECLARAWARVGCCEYGVNNRCEQMV